jgi:hypothetical protein
MEALDKAKHYSKMNKGIIKYKYSIIDGNNCALIRRCLEIRSDRWVETVNFDKLYNFKW